MSGNKFGSKTNADDIDKWPLTPILVATPPASLAASYTPTAQRLVCVLNMWVKRSSSGYTNPPSSTADILFKEIDSTFTTGSITGPTRSSYPHYANHHHTKYTDWFTGNTPVEFAFNIP